VACPLKAEICNQYATNMKPICNQNETNML
jgi:hypothetical protein